MDDIKPWNAEKELNNRKTDLWEQFGSPGFIIAMLASSFTAMPMNSALNAGAAAMNAINSGDMDKYHKAFDAWKENSSLTLKRLDLEEKQFGRSIPCAPRTWSRGARRITRIGRAVQ